LIDTMTARTLLFLAALLTAHFAIAGDPPPVDDLGVDPRKDERIVLSDLRGRVVAISFWASWCGPCLKELPVLESIQKQIPHDELRIVAINYGEDKKTFRRHLRQLEDAQLAVLHDPRNRIGKAFGVKGLPTLVLIDHRGEVHTTKTGYSDEGLQALIDEINGLLEQRARELSSATAKR
jgi:thiol-disulfide isomerase/thioredoxin